MLYTVVSVWWLTHANKHKYRRQLTCLCTHYVSMRTKESNIEPHGMAWPAKSHPHMQHTHTRNKAKMPIWRSHTKQQQQISQRPNKPTTTFEISTYLRKRFFHSSVGAFQPIILDESFAGWFAKRLPFEHTHVCGRNSIRCLTRRHTTGQRSRFDCARKHQYHGNPYMHTNGYCWCDCCWAASEWRAADKRMLDTNSSSNNNSPVDQTFELCVCNKNEHTTGTLLEMSKYTQLGWLWYGAA